MLVRILWFKETGKFSHDETWEIADSYATFPHAVWQKLLSAKYGACSTMHFMVESLNNGPDKPFFLRLFEPTKEK